MLQILYNYVIQVVSRYFAQTHLPHPKYKNKYFITYKFEGKPYNILISKKRGPHKIVAIYGKKYTDDEEEEDVFEYVQQFMGPSFDFHNINYTPSCLGYYSLTFQYIDDSEKIFKEDEIIEL